MLLHTPFDREKNYRTVKVPHETEQDYCGSSEFSSQKLALWLCFELLFMINPVSLILNTNEPLHTVIQLTTLCLFVWYVCACALIEASPLFFLCLFHSSPSPFQHVS